MTHKKTIVLLTGEASGDIIASNLIKELEETHPNTFHFCGITGPTMREAGCETWLDQQALNVMGLAEVLPHIPKFLRLIRETTQNIIRLKPDMVISVDAPDFTLRVMKNLKKARTRGDLSNNTRLIHYVAPSVWAWKAYRAKKMAPLLDHLLCLYPFEPPYFTVHGLPTTCVGHPVLQSTLRQGNKISMKSPLTLGLLPGSRGQELNYLLPLFQQIVSDMAQHHPHLSFLMLAAPHVADRLRNAMASWPVQPIFIDDPKRKADAFATMDFALAASGTVTLELAYANVPTVVIYRVHPVTAWIVGKLVRVTFASLINILVNKRIFPEYIQEKATKENILAALNPLMDLNQREAMQKDIALALTQLNPTDPPQRPSAVAAGVILDLLNHGYTANPDKPSV